MALKKMVGREKTSQRALFPDAYHRIAEIDCGGKECVVRIDTFADEDARRYNDVHPSPGGVSPLFSTRISIPFPSMATASIANMKKAVYDYIKTLETFKYAEDC